MRLGILLATATVVAAAAQGAYAAEERQGTPTQLIWAHEVPPADPFAKDPIRLPLRRPNVRGMVTDKVVAAQGLIGPGDPAPAPGASDAPPPTPYNGLNRQGLGPGCCSPSDATGAIGPEHYVEMVNSDVGVYDRNGLDEISRQDLATFVGMPSRFVFDPQVIFDPDTQRWYYVADAIEYSLLGSNDQYYLAYGFSRGPDPTEGWCRYAIPTEQLFDDYPKLGDSDEHILIGTNVFVTPLALTGAFVTSRIWALSKPPPGASGSTCSPPGWATFFGHPTSPLRTADNEVAFTPVPANSIQAASRGYIVAADPPYAASRPMSLVDDPQQLAVWHVERRGESDVLVSDGNLDLPAPYWFPPDARQPGGDVLDTLDTRLTQAVAATDPAVNEEAVWTQHTVAGANRGAELRWYQLLPASGRVRQAGRVGEPEADVYNGAVSPTAAGDAAVVHYNVSSATRHVEIRARSRRADTPLSELGPDTEIARSTHANTDFTCGSGDGRTGCRWGDYAAATPDPSNPNLVWGSNTMNYLPVGDVQWTTRNFALSPEPVPVLVLRDRELREGRSGNGNGHLDPGESFSIAPHVANAGNAAAAEVAARLSTTDAALLLTNTESLLGGLAPGAEATGPPLEGTLKPSAGCGMLVALTIRLQSTTTDQRIRFSVPVGRPSPTVLSPSSDVPKPIVDFGEAVSTLTVSEPGLIADLDVAVERISHTWVGDLRIRLEGPDGTTVMLADQPGGPWNDKDDILGLVLDDEAPRSLAAGAAPYTGRFRPVQELRVFDGRDQRGTWRLRVADVASPDAGSLHGWGLEHQRAICDPARPTAVFTASPATPLSGEDVVFDAGGSSDPHGEITRYEWDLDGDGDYETDTAGAALVTHAFPRPGEAVVGLRVTAATGQTDVLRQTISIGNRGPVAAITHAPQSPRRGDVVTFDAGGSSDPDGSLVRFEWDLDGDGVFETDTGAVPRVSHCYSSAGARRVTVRVTDDLGARATAGQEVSVRAQGPPRCRRE